MNLRELKAFLAEIPEADLDQTVVLHDDDTGHGYFIAIEKHPTRGYEISFDSSDPEYIDDRESET